jgi:tetratricopeptide (TPR) repeat protein
MKLKEFTDLEQAIIYYNMGNERLRLGNETGAIKYYSYAISHNPNLVEAYNNRGTAKAKLGNMEGSIEDYNRAIEIDPDLTAAYSNRSRARFELGNKHSISKSSSDYENSNSHSEIEFVTTNQLIANLRRMKQFHVAKSQSE